MATNMIAGFPLFAWPVDSGVSGTPSAYPQVRIAAHAALMCEANVPVIELSCVVLNPSSGRMDR
jgi:hypothetical protein